MIKSFSFLLPSRRLGLDHVKRRGAVQAVHDRKPDARRIHRFAEDNAHAVLVHLPQRREQPARDGFRLADEDEWRRRFEICKDCSSFVNNRCGKCGCYTEIKSRINAAECPLGKWSNAD